MPDDARLDAESEDDAGLEGSDPRSDRFTPEVLDKTVIAIPLLKRIRDEPRDVRAMRAKRTALNRKKRRSEADEKELQKLTRILNDLPLLFHVIIDLNLEHQGGRTSARAGIKALISEVVAEIGKHKEAQQGGISRQGVNDSKSERSQQYVFARLEGQVIQRIVELDKRRAREPRSREDGADTHSGGKGQQAGPSAGDRMIYHIWPDFVVRSLITNSIRTVKCDAARASFAAVGENIVWAVLDSGIDQGHRHFALHGNLKLTEPLKHQDFTDDNDPLADGFGHGSHVAGIIAGELVIPTTTVHPAAAPPPAVMSSSGVSDAPAGSDRSEAPLEGGDTSISQPAPAGPALAGRANPGDPIVAYSRHRDEGGEVTPEDVPIDHISGMAPKCKLLSCKVLDKDGQGLASNIIAAIDYIQEVNGHGRRLLIHGVNLSVGYDFEPEWFACGQSPLCVEVDRLVKSGVVVVVAAGNTGYGFAQTAFRGTVSAGMDLTINDPGNADLAITVGSTHRDMPHVYGVSYFSSKGPTGDGRLKPDLVAPGEKILSCAAGGRLTAMFKKFAQLKKKEPGFDSPHYCDYLEESGTSMAAPHVSGVIAAFLSIRPEFIGQPEKVKEIFLSTATDLKRERYFQGYGLVDLMRAIQSV